MEQMQWMQAIHATASQVMCMLMLAHIYIGTIGMEGAIDTMTSGEVDENWAKEHHSAWYEETMAKQAKDTAGTPKVAPAE